MRLAYGTAVAILGAGFMTGSGRSLQPVAAPRPIAVTDVIAVYVGSIGTDSLTGMDRVLEVMGAAIRKQTASTNRGFLMRGVSIEPLVEDGIRHLSRLAPFDEVSVGGNWTNSAVVRYLGVHDGRVSDSPIPELIILEREVRSDGYRMLEVGPERELNRFVGIDKIKGWVAAGAPLPQK